MTRRTVRPRPRERERQCTHGTPCSVWTARIVMLERWREGQQLFIDVSSAVYSSTQLDFYLEYYIPSSGTLQKYTLGKSMCVVCNMYWIKYVVRVLLSINVMTGIQCYLTKLHCLYTRGWFLKTVYSKSILKLDLLYCIIAQRM